jgi:hypothetical protein
MVGHPFPALFCGDGWMGVCVCVMRCDVSVRESCAVLYFTPWCSECTCYVLVTELSLKDWGCGEGGVKGPAGFRILARFSMLELVSRLFSCSSFDGCSCQDVGSPTEL